jgi:polyisoprenoid-binding protein YceI
MLKGRVSLTACLSVVMVLAGLTGYAQTSAPAYTVDPSHSSVGFKVRHLISKVSGSFAEFSGTVVGDPAKPEGAAVSFTIKAASIDTQNADRDKHLKSADFFDVEKFPEITFKSTKITPRGKDQYDVAGEFTLHGVTKAIVLPVTLTGIAKDPWGNERAGFSLQFTLNRKDYGITYNKVLDQGGMMLGDDVEVSIDLETVRKPAAKG